MTLLFLLFNQFGRLTPCCCNFLILFLSFNLLEKFLAVEGLDFFGLVWFLGFFGHAVWLVGS